MPQRVEGEGGNEEEQKDSGADRVQRVLEERDASIVELRSKLDALEKELLRQKKATLEREAKDERQRDNQVLRISHELDLLRQRAGDAGESGDQTLAVEAAYNYLSLTLTAICYAEAVPPELDVERTLVHLRPKLETNEGALKELAQMKRALDSGDPTNPDYLFYANSKMTGERVLTLIYWVDKIRTKFGF